MNINQSDSSIPNYVVPRSELLEIIEIQDRKLSDLKRTLVALIPLAESGRVFHGKFEETDPLMTQARELI